MLILVGRNICLVDLCFLFEAVRSLVRSPEFRLDLRLVLSLERVVHLMLRVITLFHCVLCNENVGVFDNEVVARTDIKLHEGLRGDVSAGNSELP